MEGDEITIDGTSGRIFIGKPQVAEFNEKANTLSKLLSKHETIPIYANVDTTINLERIKDSQPSGIGLVRTEHLLFEDEELHNHILNIMVGLDDTVQSEQIVENKYREMFTRLYEAFDDVRIRLLDIASDEIVPNDSDKRELFGLNSHEMEERLHNYRENNPAMGAKRGSRQAIKDFRIYRAQVRAASTAAEQQGKPLRLILPLIANASEVSYLRKQITDSLDSPYTLGVMIETPAALMTIESIAEVSDFLSFGTNDLYSLMTGLSRVDGKKLEETYEQKGVQLLPFQQFMGMVLSAAQKAKQSKEIPIGICGEIKYTEELLRKMKSIDYISTSMEKFLYTRVLSARAH